MTRQWAASKGERLAQGLSESVEVGDCLEWQGFFGCKGVMPIVKARNPEKARTDNYSVPRELWEAAYGTIPDGKLVYRSCCNNACVLLDHLTIGTRQQWAKHRSRTGAAKHQPATKIALTLAARSRSTTKNSMAKAREVRSLHAEGLTKAEIAARAQISESMVSDICYGRAWVDIGNPFSGLMR